MPTVPSKQFVPGKIIEGQAIMGFSLKTVIKSSSPKIKRFGGIPQRRGGICFLPC